VNQNLMRPFVLLTALVAAGCHDGNNNGGKDGGSGSGNGDLAGQGGDMVDVTPLPAPTATHLGATGVTCCTIADASNSHVVYLANLTDVTLTVDSGPIDFGTAGELHLAGADGSDVVVAPQVFVGGYTLSPDGKGVFFVTFDTANATSPSAAGLSYFAVGGTAAKVVVADNMPTTQVGQGGTQAAPVAYFGPMPLIEQPTFSPSGHFLLALAQAPDTDGGAYDLRVFDTSTGTEVLTRGNGGGNYIQVMLPDDTLFFQDTVGGTGNTGAPVTPVQTLFWVKLGSTTAPATITTHTSSYRPTGDNQTLVILKTNGDLYTFDIAKKTLGATPLATGVASFLVGGGAKGPVDWVGADRSSICRPPRPR
jgi:hypothetical protein